MADVGFDWLCIDMGHSVTDYFEAQQLIASIQSGGMRAFVRVGENNARIIKRVLDAGAEVIIDPMVNSRQDARHAVEASKYPPKGKRGVGLARAQKYGFGFEEHFRREADMITVIAQIEHIDAINNLEDIITQDGIDGTIIGPYDLSGSLGKPGRYDDDVQGALLRYETIGRRFSKPIGFHVIQPDYNLVLRKIEKGYRFIAFSLDTLFPGTLCRQQMQLLKGAKTELIFSV
jgi:2-dehydro-3-deoxyglucarate aldolase